MDEQIIYIEQDTDQENVAVDEEDTEELISIDQESTEDENISVENENVVSGMENEHDRLIHRDYEDQHPNEAITQLLQELAARPTDALTNMDIQNILNH